MNRRLYACVVLLAISICLSSGIRNDSAHQNSNIIICKSIEEKFPDIYKLLQDSLIGGSRVYQFPVFRFLSNKGTHELFIKEDSLPISVGGETRIHQINPSTLECYVKNTIVLNSRFLENSSKEYVVQVVIHESIHAFINWCKASYDTKKNGVDSAFLNTYFRLNWRLFKEKKLTEIMAHRLFVNYATSMTRCIAAYMDSTLRRTLRDSIALSLAWGGLEDTPEWRSQKDTTLMKCIDMKAKSLNALKEKFSDTCCKKPDLVIFLSQLKEMFQITKPAIRKTKTR